MKVDKYFFQKQEYQVDTERESYYNIKRIDQKNRSCCIFFLYEHGNVRMRIKGRGDDVMMPYHMTDWEITMNLITYAVF